MSTPSTGTTGSVGTNTNAQDTAQQMLDSLNQMMILNMEVTKATNIIKTADKSIDKSAVRG